MSQPFAYRQGMAIGHAVVDDSCVVGCYACWLAKQAVLAVPADVTDERGVVHRHVMRDGRCLGCCPACHPEMRYADWDGEK